MFDSVTISTTGGAFYVGIADTTTRLTGTTISNNTALFDGGGLFVAAARVRLEGARVEGNTALGTMSSSGGAVSVYIGRLELANV